MKKVLILVQSCDDAPYHEMQQAQRETWDSVTVPGVSTVYYYGNNDALGGEYRYENQKLYCPCSEAYNMMHMRHKLAVEYVWSWDWDIIFRTNASSYVHKQRLLEFAQIIDFSLGFPSKGGGVPSGCGFFLNREMAKIANDGIDFHPTPSEDMYIFSMLNRVGIGCSDEGDRVDFDHYATQAQRECYHYRCKSDTSDRGKDIIAFNKLQKQFYGIS